MWARSPEFKFYHIEIGVYYRDNSSMSLTNIPALMRFLVIQQENYKLQISILLISKYYKDGRRKILFRIDGPTCRSRITFCKVV
jgi:hypothetical protein